MSMYFICTSPYTHKHPGCKVPTDSPGQCRLVWPGTFAQTRLTRHVCPGVFAQVPLSRHVCPGSSSYQVSTGSSDQAFTCSFTRKQPRGFESSSFGRRPQKMIVSVPVIINKKHIILYLS